MQGSGPVLPPGLALGAGMTVDAGADILGWAVEFEGGSEDMLGMGAEVEGGVVVTTAVEGRDEVIVSVAVTEIVPMIGPLGLETTEVGMPEAGGAGVEEDPGTG